MKKIALLMLTFIFLLSGCSNAKTVTPITKGIEFTLNIDSGGAIYNVSSTIDNGGCLDATVNSPEAIKGMKITSNSFETLSEYKNLKYTYNEDEFSGNNIVVMVYNILSSLENKQFPSKDGENCLITGKYSDENFDFIFSPSGLPIELNIESKDLKVLFKDVTII